MEICRSGAQGGCGSRVVGSQACGLPSGLGVPPRIEQTWQQLCDKAINESTCLRYIKKIHLIHNLLENLILIQISFKRLTIRHQ